jgi:hypothetical protein
MLTFILRIGMFLCLCMTSSLSHAQPDGLGQTIQISTDFNSFLGRPIWSLIIRDIDHNQNIPYLFDFNNGLNYWVIFTYGRHYLISSSTLQIVNYRSRRNNFSNCRIRNFCNLESNGRIIRNESMYITIKGDLSPNTNTYLCNVIKFPEAHFTIDP